MMNFFICHLSYIPMHKLRLYNVVMSAVHRIADTCHAVLNKHWISTTSTLISKTKDLRKFTGSCRHFKYQTIPHVFYTYYLNNWCLIYHYMHVFCDYQRGLKSTTESVAHWIWLTWCCSSLLNHTKCVAIMHIHYLLGYMVAAAAEHMQID